jgi:hypothetical protein
MATSRERGHHAFLSKVVEQFETIARRIGEPFRAQAWNDDGAAVLAVWQQGEEDEVLRVTACFDDAAAAHANLDDVLKLTVDWEDGRLGRGCDRDAGARLARQYAGS